MLILFIELNGFKRFSLNGINHFKLKPTARVQLILGTNGSGKSSLISELSPLPGVAVNYTKEGSKIIGILHRGQNYLLSSKFSSGHVHSFLKNDEELNPGGTLTVQRELVRQEFGIRQEIHDLITGLERFTQMSPSRRREWFTEMSDAKYDYALLVYSRMRDSARDVNGALKLAKKRLVTETSKMLGESDVNRAKEEINLLVKEIDTLYQMRVDQTASMSTLETQQRHLEKEALALCHRLFSIQSAGSKLISSEKLKEEIESIKIEITSTSTKIELLVKEHAVLKETHDTCIKRGSAGLEELKERLRDAQERRTKLLETLKLGLDFLDPLSSLNALEALYPILQNVFSTLPENKERRFSQANEISFKEELLQLKNKVQTLEENLNKLSHQKRHLDELIKGEKTVCPQCNHQWTPGYSPSVYAKIGEVISSLVFKHTEELKKIKEVEAKIAENKEYGDLLKEYLTAARSTPILQPFWNYLSFDEVVYKAPRQIEVRMESLKLDLNKMIQAQEITKEIEKIKDLIQMTIKSSDVDVEKVATRLDVVDLNLGLLSQTLNQLNVRLNKSQYNLARVNEFLNLDVKIKAYQVQLETGVNDIIKALRNEMIKDALHTLQIDLAGKQKLLNDMQMQEAIINDIRIQVNNLEKQEEAYKLMVRELSPTDGLIAEGLLGFIRSFIRKMNVIIGKVWTYPMEVVDCSTETDEGAGLDYKFPLIVNDDTNPVSDVKLASVGQKEMIDLAFKIIATHQLHLSEAPLFLDEWSVSFDEAHRANASMAIKSLLEQLPFSQLWMVSHYEQNHGVFTNAEVCVLSPSNIVVPKEYNQHVEIS